MKTAVIFARTSSAGSKESRQDTGRQVEDLQRAFAGQYIIERVFEEHISGAKRNEDREVLNKCLAFCVAERIDTILTSELSRIGRSDDVLYTVKYCRDHGINIVFQNEGLSVFQADGTPSPFLNIFISCLVFAAECERSAIEFRLRSGYNRFRAAGGKVGRKPGQPLRTEEEKAALYNSEKYKRDRTLLRKGLSLRNVRAVTGTSLKTLCNIKKYMV